MASRLWASPMCFLHGSDIAILEAMRLLTIRATPFILKSILQLWFHPPHPTALFLQPPVSSPSWALHHYGLFLAWAHRSRWLNRCFMALGHLKLIMCKTDLHFSLTNLQLLHFFVFSTSTCQFVRCCSWHLSFLHRSYLQDRPVLLGTYIQHHTLYIHPPHSRRDLTKTRIWYLSFKISVDDFPLLLV